MIAAGLRWGWARVDASGPSAAGRLAAERALAGGLRLCYRGSRPIVLGGGVSISISHGRDSAVAVAGPIAHLGVDLCERDREPLLRACANRYFTAAERLVIARQGCAAAAIWAAKEAGLKALGLGLLDGGIFDDPARCAIQIASLSPPRYTAPAALAFHVERRGELVLAVAYDQTPPSTSTVAPFM